MGDILGEMIRARHIETIRIEQPWDEKVKRLKRDYKSLLNAKEILRGYSTLITLSNKGGINPSLLILRLERQIRATLDSIHERNIMIRTLSLCFRDSDLGGISPILMKKIDSYLF